jgi:glucose/mannose-6-phosphate isomerase
MAELDLPEVLGVDRAGLIDGLSSSVEVFDASRSAAEALEIPFAGDIIRDVLICGMGGSAVAGDLIATTYYERMRVPLLVHRGYYLPGWAGDHTLAMLLSYSGETEETLTAAMQALERESPAIAITSGGKLDSWYNARHGIPVHSLPGGLQHRSILCITTLKNSCSPCESPNRTRVLAICCSNSLEGPTGSWPPPCSTPSRGSTAKIWRARIC